ncbi:MAG: hypothetical protein ACW9W3_05905 [Candidatus Nitrosopumilus sp. bin_68KS]
MTSNKEDLIKKITASIQKIQDNVIPGAKGLDRTEVREHIVFWELGVLLKEYVDLESIPADNIHDELDNRFRKIEKKIRSDGIRKGMKPLPSWQYKNQMVKPPRMQEPSMTWVLICWDFIYEYQDLERWNLIANLSGAMFEDGFVRKRAEELIPFFSKADPIPNAKELQGRFVKEMSKFDKNPSRKEFGTGGGFQGLIPQIFGKYKVDINLAKKHVFGIKSVVNTLLEDEPDNYEKRNIYAKNIGIEAIDSLRRLLRLISITEEDKFQKRLKQLGNKIPRLIKTKHTESKELYAILYSLINDEKSRKQFLHRVTRHDLTILNTKLSAIATADGFREYQENQKAKEELFS